MTTFAPYHQYHDFLDCQEEQALLDYAIKNESRFEGSTLAGGVTDETRRRSQRLTDLGRPGEQFEARIRANAHDFFARAGTPPFEIEYVELEMAAHGDGAHFAAHTDIPFGWGRSPLGGDKSGTQDRIISLVYYFYREPRGFDGGALWLHRFGSNSEPGDYVEIQPERNSLVVFPSWATHEVRPVNCPSKTFADYRFAVNCWLCRTL
ncbi:MAG: 2OG-Fe(II) oxygenase [Pseudomonadota bacterium]|nr:2OG-Fe(II) oxygenase [Pseudomonadota bacterium]